MKIASQTGFRAIVAIFLMVGCASSKAKSIPKYRCDNLSELRCQLTVPIIERRPYLHAKIVPEDQWDFVSFDVPHKKYDHHYDHEQWNSIVSEAELAAVYLRKYFPNLSVYKKMTFKALLDECFKAQVRPADIARHTGMSIELITDYLYRGSSIMRDAWIELDDPDVTAFFEAQRGGTSFMLHRTKVTRRFPSHNRPYLVSFAIQQSVLQAAVSAIDVSENGFKTLASLAKPKENGIPRHQVLFGHKVEGKIKEGYFDDSYEFLYQLYPLLVQAGIDHKFDPVFITFAARMPEYYELHIKGIIIDRIIEALTQKFLTDPALHGYLFQNLKTTIDSLVDVPPILKLRRLFGSDRTLMTEISKAWALRHRGSEHRFRVMSYGIEFRNSPFDTERLLIQQEAIERAIEYILYRYQRTNVVGLPVEDIGPEKYFPVSQRLLGLNVYAKEGSKSKFAIFPSRFEFYIALRDAWRMLFKDAPDLDHQFRIYNFYYLKQDGRRLRNAGKRAAVDQYIYLLKQQLSQGSMSPRKIDDREFEALGLPAPERLFSEGYWKGNKRASQQQSICESRKEFGELLKRSWRSLYKGHDLEYAVDHFYK